MIFPPIRWIIFKPLKPTQTGPQYFVIDEPNDS